MTLDPIILAHLVKAWESTKGLRDDSQRDVSSLAALLKSPNIDWIVGPTKSVWYLTQKDSNEQSACVHVLTNNPWVWRRRAEIIDMLARIMDEHGLRKLYALIPGPAKKVKRIAYLLGFKHEGTLRESCKFDGKFTNLEVFGILRREIGRERKRAKAIRKARELDQGRPAAPAASQSIETTTEARA